MVPAGIGGRASERRPAAALGAREQPYRIRASTVGHDDRGPTPDPDDIVRIARLLGESRRGVLMVGGDVYWARAEEAVRALAEALGLPVFFNERRVALNYRLLFYAGVNF